MATPPPRTAVPGGPGRGLAILAISVLCLIWGTTWAAIEISTQAGIPPFTGIAVRFTVAGLLLWGVAVATGVRLGRTARERWLWVANGLLSFTVSYGIVYWAEQHIPPGLTAVLFAMYPLMVAILGHFMLPKERVSARESVFILLSFAGIALIYSSDFGALGGEQARWAALLMILSPLVSAVGSVLIKKFGSDLHPFSVTSMPMILTGAVFAVAATTLESEAVVSWNARSVGALFFLTVPGTVVTFSIYFWLLRHMTVRRLSLVAYIAPMVAVLVGLMRGEPMTARILVGAAVVIAGVALTTMQR